MPANADFVRKLYAAFGRGDINCILENLDPAVEWVSNGDAELIPWGGRRNGISGAASFFQSLADNLDFDAFEPREFFESGDTVIVIGRTRARVKNRGGGIFDCEWAHVFTLRNGKLARFHEFYDTAAIATAIAA